MPILNLNHVSLYYEEFGRGDRYLIQAQQFVNSHIYYTKDLADRCGFHAFIIRIRGYAPSSMVTEDLGDDWYDVWAQDVVDFADAMGIEKFFYTGHSHGAGIGWHLCMNHPDRLRGFLPAGVVPISRTASQPALPAWTPSTQRKAGRPGSPMRKSRPLTVPRRLFLWSLTPSSAERPKKR